MSKPETPWRVDTSAGRSILVYEGCSVIEGEQAEYLMRLIGADYGTAQLAAEPASIHLKDLKSALADAKALRVQLRLMEEHAKGEVWRWQGDGADNLDSMGARMGVLIYASDLKALIAAQPAAAEPFQTRVQPWLLACFGELIAGDREERNHRFLEEALELVQACGCSASEAHQLVDYVYGRPVGEAAQEVGGVMVTLAALCLANGLDMHAAAETELARIWTKVEAIRAKQAAKPKHSPLPMHVAVEQPAASTVPARWVSDQCGGEFDDMTAGQGYRKGWNDCRDAMLAAAPGSVERDSQRLDYLQNRGATIELLVHPLRFRIGGMHSAVHTDLRIAIDLAIGSSNEGAAAC